MTKVDVIGREQHVSSLSICVLREFFPTHLGLTLEQLPALPRALFAPEVDEFVFRRFALGPQLYFAARSFLSAPARVRRQASYAKAKAVELLSLLMDEMTSEGEKRRNGSVRVDARVRHAGNLLLHRCGESWTLGSLARAVGLNRTALSGGFRRLFGVSVYEFLSQVRMEHACDLLVDHTLSITEIAASVGYEHPCNFSTAFRGKFGRTPREVRARRHHIVQ